jgi:hypothetical protein
VFSGPGGTRCWCWCSVSCCVTGGAVCVVPWFGDKRTKTLFWNTAHKLRVCLFFPVLLWLPVTHITHTMKGQDSSLINIHSSQFITPPLLISYSYSCVYCVGPCVHAGMRVRHTNMKRCKTVQMKSIALETIQYWHCLHWKKGESYFENKNFGCKHEG